MGSGPAEFEASRRTRLLALYRTMVRGPLQSSPPPAFLGQGRGDPP